ncbi:MAG: DNA-protecting protein DprA, partial [Rickettsiales bacterium]|nr:DNA-protecting protein DprA [Rickettsiales bacterium]
MEFCDELFNRLLILRTARVGPAKYNELICAHGSAASAVEFLGVGQAHRDAVRRETDLALQLGVRFLSVDDAEYPARLREIKNSPPIISVRGNIAALARRATAIVGTRHASAAGMKFVFELSRLTAGQGDAVISGMAMGTDTAAHIGALDVNGATVAVLAGGVDNIWPLENENLYYRIIDCGGAVISEMPIGTAPDRNMFAIRNKWIAGMSDRMILGEADLKSG